jgi:hypothetical protein
VLDLGTNPSSTWKLVIPTEDDIKVDSYTTMSYRWGTAEFLKLKLANLADFRLGKPISILPRAFQDAITVSKALGIRYLWIDAICILQDADSDFYAECTHMSSIYANSSCNIVATFGKEPSMSLFKTRNPEALQITKITNGWKSHTSSNTWLDIDVIVEEDHLSKELMKSEVSKRGWILQELFLAPRAIYFGENQVYWSCRNTEICELWPEKHPHKIRTQIGSMSSRIHESSNNAQLEEEWFQLVFRYSSLTLSHPKDKLLALSGLAKQFQQRSKDEYVAGHWKSNLPVSLNWFRLLDSSLSDESGEALEKSYNEQERHGSIYLAPSWSWASVNGQIEFVLHGETGDLSDFVVCKVEHVETDTVGGDSTGRVLGGQLDLRAPWTKAKVGKNRPIYSGDSPWEAEFPMIEYDNGRPPLGTELYIVLTMARFWRNCIPGFEAEDTPWLLDFHTILLMPVKDQPNLHQRVGAMHVQFNMENSEQIPHTTLEFFGLHITDADLRKIAVKEDRSRRTFQII